MRTNLLFPLLLLFAGFGCSSEQPQASNGNAAGTGGGAGTNTEEPAGRGGAAVGGSGAGTGGSAGVGAAGAAAAAGGSSAGAAALGGTGPAAGTGGAEATSGTAGVTTGGAAGDAGVSAGGVTMGGAGSGSAGASGGSPAAGSGGSVADPGTDGDGDVMIGPTYADSPDLANKNVPRGKIYDFSMSSSASAIYKGDDSTLLAENQHSFERAVRVYVPSQYVDGTAAPFMVVQDGYVADITRALDNLIAETAPEKRLPAIVAIFVANGGGDSKGSQRGLEYDTLSERYTRFVETEVLPAVLGLPALLTDWPNFALTSDPEGRAAYGCSSGGAAAFTMGWFPTDKYRRIVTYSGTFVDQQDDDAAEEAMYPLGAWDYHERLIAAAGTKPLRVFLQVSENDNGAGQSEAGHHNWVLANQRMAAALGDKGYHYRFVYALGAGHCDNAVRRQTLPETLLWMWRGYPVE